MSVVRMEFFIQFDGSYGRVVMRLCDDDGQRRTIQISPRPELMAECHERLAVIAREYMGPA
jgi:hypothetical protein